MAKFDYSTCKKDGRDTVWNNKIRGILNMRYLKTSIFRIQKSTEIVLTGADVSVFRISKLAEIGALHKGSEAHSLTSDITKVAELKFL